MPVPVTQQPLFSDWLGIYLLAMTALVVLLLLVLLCIIIRRLDKITKRMDDVYNSASIFVKMGLKHFQKKR